MQSSASRGDRCNVLTLDGGGTKGFQTLGVLKEIEALVGRRLGEYFQLIYGTSTGACTGAFLALGARVEDIATFYREHIPTVLRERTPAGKSDALQEFCRTAFGKQDFSAFRTEIGIMCTDWQRARPVVLKTGSSPPGFGCTIARAVRASCSAYPIFESSRIRLHGLGTRELVDGSYCANNPVVFAIADAITGLRQSHSSLRVVSVGVGTYPAPAYRGWKGVVHLLKGIGALQKSFGINTESMEQLRRDLFPDVARSGSMIILPIAALQSTSSNRMCANSIFFSNADGGHSRVTKRMCERYCREANVPGGLFSASQLTAQPANRRRTIRQNYQHSPRGSLRF